MANSTISSNMNLVIPTVGVDPGPDWASNLNASLTLIDQHNHSNGSGVQITPAGLNISSDLSFLSNNATNLRSVRLSPQISPLAQPTDLGCLYEVGADLYYNDGLGNQIRITQSGGVAGTSGSIANLTAPASATYVSGNQTFVWQSAANTPANLDAGYIILRNNVANSKGLTVFPPNAMASDYSLVLPQIPGATSFLQIDTSGNITGGPAVSGGITGANIANATIPPSKLTAPTGLVVSAHIPGYSGGYWSLSAPSSTFVPFSANTNFPATVIELNPTDYGTALTANSGLPQITVNSMPAGYYQVTTSFLGENATNGSQNAYALTDGTTTVGSVATGVSAVQPPMVINGIFYYAASGNRTFSIQGAYISGSAVQINNDTAVSPVRQLNFIIQKIG